MLHGFRVAGLHAGLMLWAREWCTVLLIGPDDGYQAETGRPVINNTCSPLYPSCGVHKLTGLTRLVPYHC